MRQLIIFLLFLVVPASVANAATIWCNPANSGTENGTTKSTGYSTLWEAIAAMSSGDEIVIANGDWSSGYSDMTIDNSGHLPDSGTSYSTMSIIRAETDWLVKLPTLSDTGTGVQYVRIQGIIFIGADNSAYSWDYCEFIRCGFFSSAVTGNSATFGISYGTYNLIEECIAWGGGRYKFLDYHGNYNIYRRCVARHDWYISPEWEGQESNFRGYGSTNTVWQNCISIDSDREEYQTTTGTSTEDGDFWIGDQSGSGGNIIDGCIVVRGMYQAYYLGGTDAGDTTVVLRDSIAIGPSLAGELNLTGGITFGNIVADIDRVLIYDYDASPQYAVAHNKANGSATFDYSIVKNTGAFSGATADHNYYYNVSSGSFGANSVNADPEANGLLYPVRVESGSNMDTANIGPNILHKIGASGTHYGKTGWDTVTIENLWPFPNEDKIKALMSTTVDGVSGIYGFTSGTSMDGSPQTLTKYIWEQFGSQMPDGFYRHSLGTIPWPSIAQ